MTKLPGLTPIQVIRKLKKAGFVFDRQAKGSHEIWYNPKTKRSVVVPNHPGKDLPQRTLRSIVSQSGISPEDFKRLQMVEFLTDYQTRMERACAPSKSG